MRAIGENEIENALETEKILAADSRLGWEPTMGYVTDKERLRWKIKALQNVLDKELPIYMEELSCKMI
jgi:hypothetical protein